MCDLAASYRLNFPYVDNSVTPPVNEQPWTNPPTNTIPNVRTGTQWVSVLRLGSNTAFCDFLTDFPAWFTQTPAPGIVTSFQGYGVGATPRIGAVTAADHDYRTDMIDPLGSTPGADLNEQVQYLFDNLGGGGTDDHLVLTTLADTTPGTLQDKLSFPDFTVTVINPGANEVLEVTQTPGGGTGTGGTFAVALYQDAVGGQAVPLDGTFIDVNFATANLTTSIITRSGANKIFTFNEGGTYFIQAKVTLQSGFSHIRHEVQVVADTGSGYSALAASHSYGFTLNDIGDEVTVITGVIPFVATATNSIKVQVAGGTGSLAAATLGADTSLHIFKLEVDATLPYTEVTAATQTMVQGARYGANRGTLVTFTLPATAAIGTEIAVSGIGAGGWRIAQLAAQQIVTGAGAVPGVDSTTVGVTGHLDSATRYDAVSLICLTANLLWGIQSNKGAITFT